MSVRTTADEHLDAARTKLQEAQDSLHKALHPNTWGSDHFNSEFRERAEKAERAMGKAIRRLS